MVGTLFTLSSVINFDPNWLAKDVQYEQIPSQFKRLLSGSNQRKLIARRRIQITWIPELEEFPNRKARRALWIQSGPGTTEKYNLFMVQATACSPRQNIGQLIGQGYFRFNLLIGHQIIEKRVENMDVAIVGTPNEISRAQEFFESIKALKK